MIVRFNPTLVRLRHPDGLYTLAELDAVSIPRWFD